MFRYLNFNLQNKERVFIFMRIVNEMKFHKKLEKYKIVIEMSKELMKVCNMA